MSTVPIAAVARMVNLLDDMVLGEGGRGNWRRVRRADRASDAAMTNGPHGGPLGLHVQCVERLPPVPAADVDGVDVPDLRLGGEVAVAAEGVADAGVAQQRLADPAAA